MITAILSLLLMMNLYSAFAQGAAAQTSKGEIVISDPVPESKVREALGKPEGVITAEDEASLSWLDANADPNSPESTRVRDLSALRHFVNLVGIRLDSNLVSDIAVLTELPNLQELWLLENPLDSLKPLGSLTKLVNLGFSSSMRDISFIGNLTGLEELWEEQMRSDGDTVLFHRKPAEPPGVLDVGISACLLNSPRLRRWT